MKLQIAAGKATPRRRSGPLWVRTASISWTSVKTSIREDGQGRGADHPRRCHRIADRSYSFITKTPPASVLLKRAANLAKGSNEPNKNKVGTVTRKQVEDIAKLKMPDLNCGSPEAAVQDGGRHGAA